MPATLVYGAISTHEAYTLEMLATVFNRDREWVRETFVRPTVHDSGKRLLGADGRPVPGVYHFRQGGNTIIPGQCLLNWLMEHGEQTTD